MQGHSRKLGIHEVELEWYWQACTNGGARSEKAKDHTAGSCRRLDLSGGHGLPWCGQFARDEKTRTSTASHWPHATASGIKGQLFWVGAPGLLGNRFRQGDSRLKVCR